MRPAHGPGVHMPAAAGAEKGWPWQRSIFHNLSCQGRGGRRAKRPSPRTNLTAVFTEGRR
jgi:hypothetical protein